MSFQTNRLNTFNNLVLSSLLYSIITVGFAYVTNKAIVINNTCYREIAFIKYKCY